MAIPPHHGVIGEHCTRFWGRRNYPQAGGTRPATGLKVVCAQWTPTYQQYDLTKVHIQTNFIVSLYVYCKEHCMPLPVQATPPPQLDRKALSGPALRTFFRIADLWGLSVEEQMTLLG